MTEAAPDLFLVPADTTLTDRQLLVHILQHVEDFDARLRQLEELLAEFGPLIDKWRNRGRIGARLL
jgi:hypothetical protein